MSNEPDRGASALAANDMILRGFAAALRHPKGGAEAPHLRMRLLSGGGDAIRLGFPVPPAVAEWVARLRAGDLRPSFRSLVQAASAWMLEFEGADPETLAGIVEERDVAESARVFVERKLATSVLGEGDLREAKGAFEALECFDARFSERVPRRELWCMLGRRAQFGRGWSDARGGLEGDDRGDIADAARHARPDATLLGYAVGGKHRPYVEAHARAHPEFAAELEALLGVLLSTGAGLASAAADWYALRACPAAYVPMR